jgi:hypothetical protein
VTRVPAVNGRKMVLLDEPQLLNRARFPERVWVGWGITFKSWNRCFRHPEATIHLQRVKTFLLKRHGSCSDSCCKLLLKNSLWGRPTTHAARAATQEALETLLINLTREGLENRCAF